MSRLAIITARGGSKRIPHKNIKSFCGKPIIEYGIEAAKSSGLFDRIIISTDSDEIRTIAVKAGAECPFLRSEKNSDDHSTTIDVLVEVLEQLKREESYIPKQVCCIYPTAPFVSSSTLEESFKLFSLKKADSLIPVVKFDFPIQRAFKISNERIEWVSSEFALTRSQDLEECYHDVGQFYWIKASTILEKKKIITSRSIPFELSALRVQDIDNLEDWKVAEFKYKYIESLNQTLSEDSGQ